MTAPTLTVLAKDLQPGDRFGANTVFDVETNDEGTTAYVTVHEASVRKFEPDELVTISRPERAE